MAKSFIQRIVGDLEEKRAYRRFMKRVNALPKDYRFAFKKMQSYLYYTDLTGCEMLFCDLLELLEESSAQGYLVLDVIGDDVAAFCDALVHASTNTLTPGEKLNKKILKHFDREEK